MAVALAIVFLLQPAFGECFSNIKALIDACMQYTILLYYTGFTTLHTTMNSACIGEDMTISCATTSSILRWSITLADRNMAPVVRTFQVTDPVGRRHSISTSELQLDFELISNAMGTLTSTLVVHTTGLLNNAIIKCEGTTVRTHVFRIARMCSSTICLFVHVIIARFLLI